jgi:hypothetical protein
MRDRIGAERGWPPIERAQLDVEGERASLALANTGKSVLLVSSTRYWTYPWAIYRSQSQVPSGG